MFKSTSFDEQQGIILLDDAYKITDINTFMCQHFFGSAYYDVCGKSLQTIFGEQSQGLEKTLAELNHDYLDYKRANVYHPISNKIYDITMINVEKSPAKYLLTVTSRREDAFNNLKSYFDSIINHLPGVIYWKDKQGRYIWCNKFVAQTAGLDDPQEMIGKTDADFCWHDFAPSWTEMDKEVMLSGRTLVREELSRWANREGIVTLITYKSPLRNSQGEIIGIIGASLDITEKKILEAQLIKAKELAELANKLKSEFMSNMQHDIRTPISGLNLLLSTLEKSEDMNKFRLLIPKANKAAKELLQICNEVIDFENIEYGDESIQVKKFSLFTLVHSIVDLNGAAVIAKNISLSLHIEDSVPDIIKGDEHRLKKILINLVGNAIKFTEQGQVDLHIRFVRKIDTNVILQFDVCDTGIGIAAKDLDKIYEKFTRLHPSQSGLFRGTGLGLHVVKKYVDELKGEIDVVSTLGIGSHFIVNLSFELPLVASLPQLSKS